METDSAICPPLLSSSQIHNLKSNIILLPVRTLELPMEDKRDISLEYFFLIPPELMWVNGNVSYMRIVLNIHFWYGGGGTGWWWRAWRCTLTSYRCILLLFPFRVKWWWSSWWFQAHILEERNIKILSELLNSRVLENKQPTQRRVFLCYSGGNALWAYKLDVSIDMIYRVGQ